MKSKYIFLICTVLFCMLSTSCSEGSSSYSKSEPPSGTQSSNIRNDLTQDDITLTVWESAGGVDEWIKQAGVRFTQLYPNIEIEYYNVEIDDCVSELEGKAAPRPDLFGAPHDKLGELVEKGLILPTDSEVTVSTSVMDIASTAMHYNGIMYGYPTSCETYALYYNKNLISEKELPKTWEEVIAFSERFAGLFPEKYGFLFHSDSLYYTAMLMSEDGHRLLQSEEDAGLLDSSCVDGVRLLQRMAEFFPENIAEFTYEDYDNVFLQGDAAMFVNGPWMLNAAEEAGIDFGVTALPGFSESDAHSLSFSGVRGMFVSAECPYPEEAAEFARFLISEEMQQLRLKLTGCLPSVDIRVDNGYADGFIEQLGYSYPMPSYFEVDRFWQYGTDVFSKAVIQGEDAEEALRKYNDYLLSANDGSDENASVQSGLSSEE